MTGGFNIKTRLAEGRILMSVGVYDALSARIVALAGLPSIYITGYGAAASYLGVPDIGLMSMTEMVDHVRRIAAAVNCPVIADADTGYGGPANVRRTVMEYEAAGVNVIQLEDQQWPKKCGHMENKKLVDGEEMLRRIRVAVNSRRSEDFLIIARTDAIAVEGFAAAIDRARAYREAGADILFVEAPANPEQQKEIPRLLEAPCLANMVEGGKTPMASLTQLEDMGYRVAIFPISTLLTAAAAVRKAAEDLRTHGVLKDLAGDRLTFPEFNEIIGLDDYLALEKL